MKAQMGKCVGMSDAIIHGNRFSRTVANEMKKGAYYTNTEMCSRIGRLLSFPENGEVTVLEPSVGDASAVRAVLSENKTTCKTPLFAVELDKRAAAELKQTLKEDEYLLNADFIRGVTITPHVFGFCFANPPYGNDDFSKRRYEELFLKIIYSYLKKDGVVAYVVPYYLFTREEEFVSALMARFEILSMYRFDDDVYKDFKQICVMLRRKPKVEYSFGKKAYAEFLEKFPPVEELPYLPEEPKAEQLIPVPVAERKDIKVFATLLFDAEEAQSFLVGGALDGMLGEKLFGKEYTANELNDPFTPISKDSSYVIGLSGGGQGLTGDEANGTLHLQRGTVTVVVDKEVVEGKTENSAKVVEKSHAGVEMTIIENSGKITHLK